MTKNEELKIEEVVKNLQTIMCSESELRNEIIIAFEDYNHKGVCEIQVEFEGNETIRAYANHDTAPTFYIEYEQKDEVCKVKFVEVHI